MRNFVCLLGSPRPRGNSAVMAQTLCEAAAEAGAEVATFALNSLTYRGCQGCLACKKEAEACVLSDGLTPVLAAVRACDVLVLATPVYFGEVTSQLKGFIDRTFAYLKPNYPHLPRGERSRLSPGKTLVFVIAQGHPRQDLFTDIYPRYQYLLNWQGFTQSHLLRACAIYDQGAAAARPEILAEAEALGRELAQPTAQATKQG